MHHLTPRVLLILGLMAPSVSAESKLPLKLEAIAINLSNVGRAGPTRLEITIERWSTPEERDKLRDALIEKGSDALLNALKGVKPRVGYIRTSTSLAWDLQYASESEISTGGRKVVFATDRPMSFYELTQKTRSSEYDFLLAEIHLLPNGKGEGKLSPRAKITYNKDQRSIEIEDYATQPVHLGEIRETK